MKVKPKAGNAKKKKKKKDCNHPCHDKIFTVLLVIALSDQMQQKKNHYCFGNHDDVWWSRELLKSKDVTKKVQISLYSLKYHIKSGINFALNIIRWNAEETKFYNWYNIRF